MKRLSRIPTFIVALLVLLSIGFAAYTFWFNATAQSRYETRVTERQKEGYPSHLADLNGEAVPSDKDAAAQLASIADAMKDLHSRIDEHLPDDAIPNRYLTENELTPIQALFLDKLSLLQQLTAISQLPSFYSPLPQEARFADVIDNSISADLTHLSMACDLLRTRALQTHAEDQLDESLQSLYSALAYAQLANQAPIADGFLFFTRETTLTLKTLNLVLQQSSLSEPQYTELKFKLNQIQTTAALRKAFIADSAAYATGLIEQEGALSWFNRGRVYSALVYHYDMYDGFTADLELPLDQWEAKYGGFDTPFSWNPFINLVNLNQANCLAYRTIAERIEILKKTVLALAKVQQKVATNTTDITIGNLGLTADEIADPYSKQPLILKGSPGEGWFIYSVSSNRQDDGGDFESGKDHGIGPPQVANNGQP